MDLSKAAIFDLRSVFPSCVLGKSAPKFIPGDRGCVILRAKRPGTTAAPGTLYARCDIICEIMNRVSLSAGRVARDQVE